MNWGTASPAPACLGAAVLAVAAPVCKPPFPGGPPLPPFLQVSTGRLGGACWSPGPRHPVKSPASFRVDAAVAKALAILFSLKRKQHSRPQIISKSNF